MQLNIQSKIKLNNGVEIPRLGLGVYLIDDGKEVENAIKWAFEKGYRHVDTAAAYNNETGVGSTVRESKISREEIFVTTKLANGDQGYDSALKAFEKSLNKLGLDYVDLYLIHWPETGKRKDSWKAFEEIYKSGRTKSIGVSNYTIRHLEELFSYSDVIPVINQVEFNPFLYQKDLLDFCHKNNVRLEAYSPLVKAQKLENKVLQNISKKYSKSSAQILIRWALQHDLVVIPKSSNKNRIFENAEVFDFEISSEDMDKLNSLDEGFRASWNPSELV
jgi:methylglyoxal/glyoxal reductase